MSENPEMGVTGGPCTAEATGGTGEAPEGCVGWSSESEYGGELPDQMPEGDALWQEWETTRFPDYVPRGKRMYAAIIREIKNPPIKLVDLELQKETSTTEVRGVPISE